MNSWDHNVADLLKKVDEQWIPISRSRVTAFGAVISTIEQQEIGDHVLFGIPTQFGIKEQQAMVTGHIGEEQIVRWCIEPTTSRRWICGEEHMPTGVLGNPSSLEDLLYFSVYDLSPEGMCLVTSLRNDFLKVGWKLEGFFTFPFVGMTRIECEIKWLRMRQSSGRDQFHIGVQVLSTGHKELFSEYASLFAIGAPPHELSRGNWQCRYAISRSELKGFINLRNRVIDGKTLSAHDPTSRFLALSHRDSSLAFAQLSMPMFNDPLWLERWGRVPEDFPRNDELLEVFIGREIEQQIEMPLIIAIMRNVLRIAVCTQRDFVIIIAPRTAWLPLQKIGGKLIGLCGYSSSLGAFEFSAKNLAHGFGVNSLYWNLLGCHELWNKVMSSKTTTITPYHYFRYFMLQLMRPVAKIYSKAI